MREKVKLLGVWTGAVIALCAAVFALACVRAFPIFGGESTAENARVAAEVTRGQGEDETRERAVVM